jgi:hypothetical protein
VGQSAEVALYLQRLEELAEPLTAFLRQRTVVPAAGQLQGELHVPELDFG